MCFPFFNNNVLINWFFYFTTPAILTFPCAYTNNYAVLTNAVGAYYENIYFANKQLGSVEIYRDKFSTETVCVVIGY